MNNATTLVQHVMHLMSSTRVIIVSSRKQRWAAVKIGPMPLKVHSRITQIERLRAYHTKIKVPTKSVIVHTIFNTPISRIVKLITDTTKALIPIKCCICNIHMLIRILQQLTIPYLKCRIIIQYKIIKHMITDKEYQLIILQLLIREVDTFRIESFVNQ